MDHVGIAVENLAEARERFARLLGLEPSPVEEVPSEGVRLCYFDLGGCRLELLEAIGAASPVRKFLDRGLRGVHHVSLAVEGGDIAALHAELRARGLPVIGTGPRPGSEGSAVFFVHPSGADGVLFEFSSKERPSERT